MKKYLKAIGLTFVLSMIMSLTAVFVASADVTNGFWIKGSNGELYTNSGNGRGNAIINVAGCNGCGGGGGVSSLNGLLGDINLIEGQNVTIGNIGNDIQISANFTQQGKYMISGGAVWSGTGLTYNVSIISYFFNGLKTGSQTNVTLDPSDPLENRLDAIVVDESGNVSVITGDPSASPVTPPIPEDQLLVQYILVEAGSTQPTVVQDAIYLDSPTTNWTNSTYTAGTPATGSINFAGTTAPKQGINDIEADTDLRLGARFVRSSAIDLQSYTMYSVWVRFTAPVATNKSLNVRFENTSGALIGNTVNLFSYGLNRNIVNTWQLVIVPVPAFGNITSVKGLRAIMSGGTVGVKTKWDMDYMLLSNGSTPQANVPTLSFYKNGTGIAAQSGINLIEGTGVTITGVNNPTNNRVDYTINASGGSSPITIGTSGNTLYSSGLSGTGQGSTSLGNNIILGTNAGNGATGAGYSNFIGSDSGNGAASADNSNFVGSNSGQNATNSSGSNFIGSGAGFQATNAANSIFIGTLSGQNDTVNNTPLTNDFSILIGNNTSTGGFKNSIAIGGLATNTATNEFMIGSATRPITNIQWQGILTSSDMHNNAIAQGNASVQQVRSGTYTPTLTNVTNITASTAYKFQWTRVGNVVTVSGRVNIENTGTGASELGISLPIASDIGATTDCVGSAPGSTSGVLDDMGWVIGDATNNRAAMQSTALSTAAHDHWVSFTYEVK